MRSRSCSAASRVVGCTSFVKMWYWACSRDNICMYSYAFFPTQLYLTICSLAAAQIHQVNRRPPLGERCDFDVYEVCSIGTGHLYTCKPLLSRKERWYILGSPWWIYAHRANDKFVHHHIFWMDTFEFDDKLFSIIGSAIGFSLKELIFEHCTLFRHLSFSPRHRCTDAIDLYLLPLRPVCQLLQFLATRLDTLHLTVYVLLCLLAKVYRCALDAFFPDTP